MRLILEYCSHHNLSVVIEGVETVEQHNVLQQLGAELVQGFFYGRPARFDRLHVRAKAAYG